MCGLIVVDAGRSRSTNLERDAYIHDHCLGYRHNYLLFYQLPWILLFGLICLCKKLKWEKAVYVCHFTHGGDTFPLGTTSLLEGSSGFQESYTKACPNSAKKLPQHVGAMTCHDTMPSFMIFRCVLDLHDFKNQVSQCFQPSHYA